MDTRKGEENVHALWAQGLAYTSWWSLLTCFHPHEVAPSPPGEGKECLHTLAYLNSPHSFTQKIFLSTYHSAVPRLHSIRHRASRETAHVPSTHPYLHHQSWLTNMPLGPDSQKSIIIKISHCFFFPFNKFPFIKIQNFYFRLSALSTSSTVEIFNPSIKVSSYRKIRAKKYLL